MTKASKPQAQSVFQPVDELSGRDGPSLVLLRPRGPWLWPQNTLPGRGPETERSTPKVWSDHRPRPSVVAVVRAPATPQRNPGKRSGCWKTQTTANQESLEEQEKAEEEEVEKKEEEE
ncbi:unnamed protein product [Lota lota]